MDWNAKRGRNIRRLRKNCGAGGLPHIPGHEHGDSYGPPEYPLQQLRLVILSVGQDYRVRAINEHNEIFIANYGCIEMTFPLKSIIVYNGFGEIIRWGNTQEAKESENEYQIPGEVADITMEFVDVRSSVPAIKRKPERPSARHTWDWTVLDWTLQANALEEEKSVRARAVDALRDSKLDEPILYNGVVFDADPLSVSNIEGLARRIERGGGLTPGWLGWRTFDNTMVWVSATPAEVLSSLYGISRALEDRRQYVMAAAWRHKDALHALPTIDAVTGYDITAGWPT